MEEEQIRQTTMIVALLAGIVLFFLYYWDPIGKVIRKYEPDPEKGFKIIFLIGCALWVIVGIFMSIGIMLRLLGVF